VPKRVRNLVRKPGKKGWWFRRKEGGRTIWRSLGTDYDAACDEVKKLKGETVHWPSLTVKKAAELWLESYVGVNRRVADRKLAAQRVRDYLVPALGHYRVARVRGEHLRRYRLGLEQGHLSPQSVAHVLADCRCFLRWCEESGLIDRAPIPRKFLPRLQERAPDRLTDDEVKKLVALREPFGFYARFLLSTGLRWGEFARLSTADVQASTVVIYHTKSGKVRRVPLPVALRRELDGRVGKLTHLKKAESFNGFVRRTGLDGFHVHQLRHTFATKWIEDGGSLAALQAILGHASVVTTQRYAKLSDEAVRREATRLGERVPKGVPAEVEDSEVATG